MMLRISRKNIWSIFYSFLVFCYIFSFPIISVVDSTILVGIVLFIFFLIHPKFRERLYKIFKSRKLIECFLVSMFICIWSLFCLVLNGSSDFSFLVTFFHLIVSLIIGIIMVAYLWEIRFNFINLIIIAFLLQTIIQWICFFSENFFMMTAMFRPESSIQNYIKYTGIRGLAISGTGFFGIASAYGLAVILYVTDYNTLFKKSLLKIIGYFFLCSGVFFAGRTGYIGIFFSVFYLCLKKHKEVIPYKSFIRFFVLLFFLLLCIVLILRTRNIEGFEILYNYTFEPLINLFNGNGFSATSLDSLSNMYIDIPLKTFFIGDGLYEVNGGYYMSTDVGYFRPVLFSGLIGLLSLFLFQIKLFVNKRDKLSFLIFIYFCVLQLKGEIIGFSIIIQSMVLLYAFCGKTTSNRY